MKADWWHSDDGENMLKGVHGDPDNPPKLPDDYIVSFLIRIPEAREAFNRMVPQLLPEEQDRCYALQACTVDRLIIDPVIKSDYVQTKWNTENVLTAGKYGGTRRGGNR